ncbi:hypothetical protein DL546_002121 [Coniochaeta pulveracea]|uniref:Major facilitator superfamily (MFS) profile domain-containing protein n=1 Tax=Coniochaeta pulveracea TaxID=177199 RepID=A0A420Y5A3_9PEZI|nr:hypothetical protein DL546_002121 [Coniochaeta pulveracea]
MSDREFQRPSRDVEEGKREPVSEGESESTSYATPTTGEQALGEKTGPPAFVNDAPDGGTAAWLCVLGAWCTSFCSFGWLNSMGAFQEYYQTGPLSSYSASTVAWIPSLQIFFIFAMGPIVGKFYDSHGPRPLLLLGSFLHVFGIMMASISTRYYQFLLSQGVCSAIGVAFIFQPPIACIAGWFNKNRGAAYGILSTGSSIGGIIFPIMITRLIRTTGYGWSMRAGAFMILGLLVIANLTVTSRHPPRPKMMTKALMVKPLKEPGFVILLVGLFLLTFGIFVPIDYIQIQAIEQGGMNPDLAQYMIAILNAGRYVSNSPLSSIHVRLRETSN